jgi:hypothetical protein
VAALIHDWAKMLKIAGQQMGCFRRPGREEDGLIFVAELKATQVGGSI